MIVNPHPLPVLKPLAAEALALLVQLHAEYLVAGTYHRGTAGTAAVGFIVEPVPAAWVGIVIQPNDERIFIPAPDLAALVNLQPGDYLVETTSGLRRDIITAHLDLAGVLWTLVGRRVFP